MMFPCWNQGSIVYDVVEVAVVILVVNGEEIAVAPTKSDSNFEDGSVVLVVAG